MLKKLIGGALAASLVFAAAAEASTMNLAGTTDGGGTIAMTVKDKGSFKVTKFRFHGVPISCAHGEFKVGVDTTGHEFTPDSVGRVTDTLYPFGAENASLKFKIKLKNGGANALGGLRLQGDGVRVQGRQKRQNGCDTGRVHWTAAAAG
jgi:hypothetical protein